MRRRSYYSGPRPYSSTSQQSSPDELTSTLYDRLPTLLILSSFLVGWLLGRHEGARGLSANVALQSRDVFRTAFAGLAAVQNECESADGKRSNIASCSMPMLMGKLMRQRMALERRMQSTKGYGPYYRSIFNEVTTKPSSAFPASSTANGRKRRRKQTPLFLASPESTDKLVRRILIKHLQAVVRDQSSNDGPPPTFTWITAGDAAAAAHGNLFSQSYTALLQDTVGDAFRSLGVRFEARNYGMGQYSSGPELGLCMREVFGDDIDALMWDFASLQPSWEPPRRSILWSNRAGIHPTRPILFSFDTVGERFASMGAGGTGSILMDADALQFLRETVPDSQVVLGLPDRLRNYRCGATIEGGARCNDPMRNFVCYLDDGMIAGGGATDSVASANACRENKFRTKPECTDARYQASWHPGWKDHELKGRLIGHFLLNYLEDAIFQLDRLKSEHGDDPQTILDLLAGLDQQDARNFRQNRPDTTVWEKDGAVYDRMGSGMVLRAESICHTALLPSKSRLEGITTEDDSGVFDKGKAQLLMSTIDDGLLPLSFDLNDRQQCELLEIDHKDFFLVREQDGWLSTMVPNNRELDVYTRETPTEGIIVLCLKICPLNKCPDMYMSINELGRKLFITVDDEAVVKVQKLDSCHILEGERGIRSWGRSDQYELKIRINDPNHVGVLKISSIIVF